MYTADVELRSLSPLQQSRYVKKVLKDNQTEAQWEEEHWIERAHFDPKGNAYHPAVAFKKCLEDCAQFLAIPIPGSKGARYSKNFKQGTMVPAAPTIGHTRETVTPLTLFVPADGRRGGGKRVEKIFPVFQTWSAKVQYIVIDDKIPKDVFETVLKKSGMLVGVGAFRPQNGGYFGRFEVSKIKYAT